MSIDIGSVVPVFVLTGADGQEWGPVGGSATVLVFTSEHCPYARAWHDRLLAVRDADGKLRYRGAPDADHEDLSLQARWLRNALDTVLTGAPVAEAVTQPVGCSITWRQ